MEQYRQWDLEHPKPTFSEDVKTYLERWYQGDKTKALNLGLDLQGGMHLVLKVDADAAITNEMVRMKNNLRKHFIDNHITVGSISSRAIPCKSRRATHARPLNGWRQEGGTHGWLPVAVFQRLI